MGYKQKQKLEQINKYHWNADERVKKLEIQSKSDTVWSAAEKEHQEKIRWEKTMKRKMSMAGTEVSLKRKAELKAKSKTNTNERGAKAEERKKKSEEKKKKAE